MSPTLTVAVIVFTGFVFGEVANRLRIPKVTGYILAGIFLNPGLFGFIKNDFARHTDVVTNISLSFITFSVGGTLLFSKLRRLGKTIIYITFFEGEFAFLAVMGGLLIVLPFYFSGNWLVAYLPLAMLLGCLASPTDPSATLAVKEQYHAKGNVSSTILGIAAFDDALGIINFSLAVSIAQTLITNSGFNITNALLMPLWKIGGSIVLGVLMGIAFNLVTSWIKRETEGALIVFIFALLTLMFGLAKILHVDELLGTMAMGAVVINYNHLSKKIFRMLERYTSELIFVLFFTLSGMHLDFSVFKSYLLLVVFFVLLRTIGKLAGAFTGAHLAGERSKVRKYTAGGLIPQGGIVVGLALLIKGYPQFDKIGDCIIAVIVGATLIHEIIGPIVARTVLEKAGEISSEKISKKKDIKTAK